MPSKNLPLKKSDYVPHCIKTPAPMCSGLNIEVDEMFTSLSAARNYILSQNIRDAYNCSEKRKPRIRKILVLNFMAAT